VRSSIRRGPGQGDDSLPLDADPAAVRRRWATVWAILGLPGLPAGPRGGAPAVAGTPPASRTRDGPPDGAGAGGGAAAATGRTPTTAEAPALHATRRTTKARRRRTSGALS
jgi:hypothetical protein